MGPPSSRRPTPRRHATTGDLIETVDETLVGVLNNTMTLEIADRVFRGAARLTKLIEVECHYGDKQHRRAELPFRAPNQKGIPTRTRKE